MTSSGTFRRRTSRGGSRGFPRKPDSATSTGEFLGVGEHNRDTVNKANKKGNEPGTPAAIINAADAGLWQAKERDQNG